MTSLEAQMNIDGEDFEILRDGQIVVARAKGRLLPWTVGRIIQFLPETDVQKGDVAFSIRRRQQYEVEHVERDERDGHLHALRAYYLSESRIVVPPANHVTIGTMANSVIQQGSPGATANIKVITGEAAIAVEDILKRVIELLDTLPLTDEDKEEVRTDVQTAETQLQAKKPKSGIISTCLQSVLAKLTAAAASPLADHVKAGVQWSIDHITAALRNL